MLNVSLIDLCIKLSTARTFDHEAPQVQQQKFFFYALKSTSKALKALNRKVQSSYNGFFN